MCSCIVKGILLHGQFRQLGNSRGRSLPALNQNRLFDKRTANIIVTWWKLLGPYLHLRTCHWSRHRDGIVVLRQPSKIGLRAGSLWRLNGLPSTGPNFSGTGFFAGHFDLLTTSEDAEWKTYKSATSAS